MGKFLISMGNSENKNCATLTLDETYDKFEKNREARNLSSETMKEYYNNYRYFCEFLNYLSDNFRCADNYVRPSLQ